MLTPPALKALNITTDADLPRGNRLERDQSGGLTGAITGNLVELFDRLPKPTFEEQVEAPGLSSASSIDWGSRASSILAATT